MKKCIEFCKLCMDPLAECVDAFQYAQLDRGKMMHACGDACAKYAAE